MGPTEQALHLTRTVLFLWFRALLLLPRAREPIRQCSTMGLASRMKALSSSPTPPVPPQRPNAPQPAQARPQSAAVKDPKAKAKAPAQPAFSANAKAQWDTLVQSVPVWAQSAKESVASLVDTAVTSYPPQASWSMPSLPVALGGSKYLPMVRSRLEQTARANGLGRVYTAQRLEATPQRAAQVSSAVPFMLCWSVCPLCLPHFAWWPCRWITMRCASAGTCPVWSWPWTWPRWCAGF
jgi:hypothetical protein